MRRTICLLMLCCLLPAAWAGDAAREQRIAEQIRDAILDGEVLTLEAAGQPFLAIHQRTERSPARGAALILHGRGANPDWVDVIHPLRTILPEHGWDTLSIQLPVASEGAGETEWQATIGEATPRITAALTWLKQQGMQNVVLIAHSFGNLAAAEYLVSQPADPLQAWVAIGMPETPGLTPRLKKITLPVLELYGERDLPGVLAGVRARRLALRGNKNWTWRESPDADHFFGGMDELLVSTVRAWINKVASGTEVRR